MIYFQVKEYLISIVLHLLEKMKRSGLFVPSWTKYSLFNSFDDNISFKFHTWPT